MLELRLMHNFTQLTGHLIPERLPPSHIFPERTPPPQMWTTTVPALAFNSELALSAILALSALHLQMLLPHDSDVAYARSHYCHRTISLYRREMAIINKDNAESVLITALVIENMAWLDAAPQVMAASVPVDGKSRGDEVSRRMATRKMENYEFDIRVYHLARGIWPLFTQLRPFLEERKSQYTEVLFFRSFPVQLEDVSILEAPQQLPGNKVGRMQEETAFEAGLRADLRQLLSGIEDEDEAKITKEEKIIYYTFSGLLLKSAHTISSSIDPENFPKRLQLFILPFFPLAVPEHFLTMLERGDPLSRALLARSLALLSCVGPMWWSHGYDGEFAVAHSNGGGSKKARHREGLPEWHIRGLVSLTSSEWQWAMEWPIDVIERRITPMGYNTSYL